MKSTHDFYPAPYVLEPRNDELYRRLTLFFQQRPHLRWTADGSRIQLTLCADEYSQLTSNLIDQLGVAPISLDL